MINCKRSSHVADKMEDYSEDLSVRPYVCFISETTQQISIRFDFGVNI
jgi:hypothetical protein